MMALNAMPLPEDFDLQCLMIDKTLQYHRYVRSSELVGQWFWVIYYVCS